MQYTFKKGARVRGLDPNKTGAELEKIRSNNQGLLQAGDVVNAARSKRSPLHDYFEWDDSLAAEEHRKEQARQLIRSVKVVYQTDRNDIKQVPLYINLEATEDNKRAYYNVVDVMSHSSLRAQAKKKAWGDIIAWKERYKELEDAEEFVRLFTTIKEMEAQELAG